MEPDEAILLAPGPFDDQLASSEGADGSHAPHRPPGSRVATFGTTSDAELGAKRCKSHDAGVLPAIPGGELPILGCHDGQGAHHLWLTADLRGDGHGLAGLGGGDPAEVGPTFSHSQKTRSTTVRARRVMRR